MAIQGQDFTEHELRSLSGIVAEWRERGKEIEILDSIVGIQGEEIRTLKGVVCEKDSLIALEGEIRAVERKKEKRVLLWSWIALAGMTVIALLK